MNREAMMVKKDAVRAVLDGDIGALGRAFRWSQSPQAWKYWGKRYAGREPLSDDDRAFLESLLIDEPQAPDMSAIAEELAKALEPLAFLECATTQEAWEMFYRAPGKTWIGFDQIDAARAAFAAYRAAKEGGDA